MSVCVCFCCITKCYINIERNQKQQPLIKLIVNTGGSFSSHISINLDIYWLVPSTEVEFSEKSDLIGKKL